MRERDIFIEALQRAAPAEVDAYLAAACGGDDALRSRVDQLLAEHRRQESFILDSPPAELGAIVGLPGEPQIAAERPSSRIGAYELLEQIGEGGMGVVFLAEQARPVRRKVALKLIKPGVDTRQVIARFEAERQALAVMDHPNIAKVFDAGVTDTGRPYFVMELVKGTAITKYCDEHRLTPRQRLGLFIQVCQAVQHAHQKGIIHRDLKPNNVLVALYDGNPVPKVIDFGVAKATGQRLTDATMFTGFGDVIGTLEYMSPEQAEVNQLDVDTRSDVYSLGVLLYELLTGSTPLEQSAIVRAGLVEMLRVVREEEPPRPSIRLSTMEQLPGIAACRGLEPKKLGGLVRGELDWIVMKALEKDRARRYETATELAAEVKRYLGDESVQACPPNPAYRLRKFARRYRSALTVAAAFGVFLIAATAVSSWQALRATRAERQVALERDQATAEKRRADEQAAVARTVSRFQTDMLVSADPEGMGDKVTVLQAVTAAQKEVDAGSLRDQPRVEASVREAIGVTLRGLGRYDEAESNLKRAMDLRRGQFPDAAADLATTLSELAVLRYEQRRLVEAEALNREALSIRRNALPAGDRLIAISLSNLASDLHRAGRFAEAEPLFREALDIYRARRPVPERDVANLLGDWGMMRKYQGRLTEAESMFREVLETNRRIRTPEHPDIAWSLTLVGSLRAAQQQPAEAEQLHREAVAIYRSTLPPGHPRIAQALNLLCHALQAQRKLDEAEPAAREALEIRRTLRPPDPRILESLITLAGVLRAKGDLGGAEPFYREALDGLDALASASEADRVRAAETRLALGCILTTLGRFPEAETMLLPAEKCLGAGASQSAREAVTAALVELYTAWDKADAGKGHANTAREWNARRPSRETPPVHVSPTTAPRPVDTTSSNK